MTEVEKLRPPMACNHGDEGEADCKGLREEVCEELGCEPDELVTAVVKHLNWSFTYDVTITGIPTDMWSAVMSECKRYMTTEELDALPEDSSSADEWVTLAEAYVQCDRIEDGFALTWRTWKDWFEERERAEAVEEHSRLSHEIETGNDDPAA